MSWQAWQTVLTIFSEAILSPLKFGANSAPALATLVCQGSYNWSSDSFYESMLGDWEGLPDLDAGYGYWAYMNVAKEFGVVGVGE